MYASASGYRAPQRSAQRSRTQSDSGHSYVTPSYTVQRPAPLHQATAPAGMIARPGTPYPFHTLPVERTTRTRHPSSAANVLSGASPSAFVSPRPPSPLRPGRQRSTSKQASVRPPQGPAFVDIPQPSRHVPSVVPAVPHPQPHPYPVGWGQGQGYGFPAPPQHLPAPSPFHSADMQRQGSQRTVYQHVPTGVYQVTAARHPSHHSHHPSVHHQPSVSHPTHHRSRSRPPSAASHRYASSITQPTYGHGSSASSHTSLNGGVSSQRVHRASTPPPGVPSSHHPGTELTSGLPHGSLSHPHVHASSETTATAHLVPGLEKHLHGFPSPPLAARELRRSPHRPALPTNYDGRTQTRYVSMLLALDGISPLFNVLAAFFTWILLAGFMLFPATFASWQGELTRTPQSAILSVVDHVPLYVIAWLCTGIGASGMIWLWWRWYNNYIWIANRIFIPGCLNSIAGVISTLSNIYGVQAGVFGTTEKSTIIVTSALSLICGVLVLVYEFWLIRNLKLEHDHIIGVELAGKHGEGILGAERDGQG